MKKLILVILLSIFCSSFVFSNNIWDDIINKTWLYESKFPSYEIIFYKSSNGLQKAIIQRHGSGIYITSSEIYDVQIRNKYITLKDGLNLNSNKSLPSQLLVYESSNKIKTEENDIIKIFYNFPIIYSWFSRKRYKVDYNSLSKIPIGENEIYEKSQIERILYYDNL